MPCRKRKCTDNMLELGSDGLATVNLVKSIKYCGFCGNHFLQCGCEGLGGGNMILHPLHLPDLPAEMLPADRLYRWHVLYQATSMMMCNKHPTEYLVKEYTAAAVHFATKNKEPLLAAAKAYVAGLREPFSWNEVKTDLLSADKAFNCHAPLQEVFSPVSISTEDKLEAYIVNAAQLFGDTHWSYMSTLHIVFVRMLLIKATAIALEERRIMAGIAAGFWHTDLTLYSGLPWLALDNSKQQLECLLEEGL